MGPKTPVPEQDFFRQPLREQINLKRALVGLAELINWDRLGVLMSESFVSGKGRPASSPRLIAGLLYLQHAFEQAVNPIRSVVLDDHRAVSDAPGPSVRG